MASLVESIWKELGSFSGFGFLSKPREQRSISLINLPTISTSENKQHRSPSLSIDRVNHPKSSLTTNIFWENQENQSSQHVEVGVLYQITATQKLKIIRENPDATGVLFKENKFVLDSLHWHNILRIKHQVPPLSLSIQLCQKAQNWANILAHRDVFYHRNQPDIGENLLLKCSSLHEIEVNGEQATKYWYGEIDHYRFDLNSDLLHTQASQFTQLIWGNSKKFGIGKARSRSGKLILVANYEPPGNIKGEFHFNVFPPFQDIELDNPADLIALNRGKVHRALGRNLRTRRKAISSFD